MRTKGRVVSAMAAVVCLAGLAAGVASAQDAQPAAANAAELLEALRAAGVEIPEGFVANEDGTVSTPDGGEAAAAVEGAAAAAPSSAEATAQAIEETPSVVWENQLQASLSYSDGNTEQLTARVGVTSVRDSERSKLSLDASAFYATDSGDESANEATVGALHDWKFPGSRWIAFAEGRYNYNEFDAFLHRVSFFAGPGYKAIDRDDMELILRAGLGGRRDFGGEEDSNDIEFEALVGFDYSWDITDRQRLFVNHRTYPSLEDASEFRAFTQGGWQIDMDDVLDGLTFNVGVEHEYQTPVPEDVSKSDLRVFAGLGLGF